MSRRRCHVGDKILRASAEPSVVNQSTNFPVFVRFSLQAYVPSILFPCGEGTISLVNTMVQKQCVGHSEVLNVKDLYAVDSKVQGLLQLPTNKLLAVAKMRPCMVSRALLPKSVIS